jgi:hypothetical protein
MYSDNIYSSWLQTAETLMEEFLNKTTVKTISETITNPEMRKNPPEICCTQGIF